LAALSTPSRVPSDGTFAAKRTCPRVDRASLDTVGSSAVSGLLSLTPGTLATAVTMVLTDLALPESVILPVLTVNRICPVAPVWSNRSPRMS